MKKHLFLFISLLLATLAGKAQLTANTVWYTDNQSADTYIISTAQQLAGLAELVNTGTTYFEGKTISLGNDIDLTDWLTDGNGGYNGGAGWKPIGTIEVMINERLTLFRGIFNGNGKTISGLWINRPTENGIGLFGDTSPLCTIQNLAVETDATTGIVGKDYVGVLFGGNGCVVTNCHVSGTVTGQNRVGGLAGVIGFGGGPVTNCFANVHVTGLDELGGLIGGSAVVVANSYAIGSVTGNSETVDIGGLIGYGDQDDVTGCFHTGADNGVGTVSTIANMQQQSTYTGWDFTGTGTAPSVWVIDPFLNSGFPVLRVFYPGMDWHFDRTAGQTSFTLSTAEELAGLSKLVYAGHTFADTTFLLGNDINLTDWLTTNGGTEGWLPIRFFEGTFEGNGHTISGLWINRPANYTVGLFGTNTGYIRKLTVSIDNTLEKGGIQGGNYVGGLVGLNTGILSGCTVVQQEVSGSAVRGTTESSTSTYTGGLAGIHVNFTITHCRAFVTVEGSGTGNEISIGGLAGAVQNGTITNCYATGTVSNTGSAPVSATGGLAGINEGTITTSFFLQNGAMNGIGQNTGIGTAGSLTADAMKIQASFTGWDFSTDWAIDAAATNPFNGGLPYLRWETPTVTFTVGTNDHFTYTVAGTPVVADRNLFAVTTGNAFSFALIPHEGYSADNAILTATGLQGGTSTVASSGDRLYTLTNVVCDSTFTVAGIQAIPPQPSQHALTLTADEGIILQPGAGTHGATVGSSFTFYVTLAPGFEGRMPQATVNGDPVTLTLRPGGTEWMYTIPQVYDDTRVIVSFATTGNQAIDAPRIYSRDGQLFVETATPLTLSVYSATGQAVVSRHLTEGLTTIPLPTGIYIVQMDNNVVKITVKK